MKQIRIEKPNRPDFDRGLRFWREPEVRDYAGRETA